MENKAPKKMIDTDASVAKMVREWDVVKCRICGKKISMLTAKSVNEGQYFVCKEH